MEYFSLMDIDWKAFNKHISSGLNTSEMINVAPAVDCLYKAKGVI